MRPCTVPGRTVRSTSELASTSPKRLVRLRTSSSAVGFPTRDSARATASEVMAATDGLRRPYPDVYPWLYPCLEARSTMFRKRTAHVTLSCPGEHDMTRSRGLRFAP